MGKERRLKKWLGGVGRGLFSRLRNKITLPFALLTLLIAAAGTFLTVQLIGVSLEERLTSYVADAIAVARQGVTRLQEEQLAALRAITYTEGVAQALAHGDGDHLANLLIPLKMNYGLDAVEVIDTTGQEVLGIHHHPNSARAEEFASSQKKDLSSWPIVQKILAGQVDQIGDKHAEILPSPSGHILWIGGPVREEEGVIGGILIGTYLDNLAQELAEEAVARVSIYDKEGHLLASTLFPEGGEMSLEGEVPVKLERESALTLLEPLTWEGREYLVGYAPLSVRGEEVGILSTAVSTEYIGQADLRARMAMMALFSIAGLAVLFLGYLIASHITTPLQSLAAISRQVATGDFTQRVEHISNDEIGQLARAFNFMTGELEKHTEQLSHRIAELTLLYETSTHLNKTLDLAEILKVAVDTLYRSGEASLVLLLLQRETGKDWSWVAARGLAPAQRKELFSHTLKALPPSVLSVTDGAKPLILHQQREVKVLKEEIGLDMEVSSLMVIPLTSPGQLMGLILLGERKASAFSDEAQLRLIHTISAEISWAIHNARLYAQVTEKVNQLATLQQVSRSITAKLPRDEVLEQILCDITEISHADSATISLWDPTAERLQLGAYRGIAPEEGNGDWPGRKMAERAVLDGHPFTTKGDAIVPVSLADSDLELGDSLCVPIQAEDQVLGAIFVRLALPSNNFPPGDLVVLTTVANQAGLALKKALLYEDIKSLYHNVVKSLATAIDARDPYTHGHSHRVTANSVVLAEDLGLDQNQRKTVEIAAYLHDIGKIGLRDAILLKNGPLSSDEKSLVEEHPVVGARILEPVGFDEEVVSMVLSHHERIDGQGYPSGLKGNAIPIGARILCVVDAFDAMVSHRPYRSGLSVEAAVRELRTNMGTQFDPELVEKFTVLLSEGKVILPGQAIGQELELSEVSLRASNLMHIKGIGEEYSDLLEEAGVDTVKELRNRVPATLHQKIVEMIEAKRLVRRRPALSQVESWVNQAKSLLPKVDLASKSGPQGR